MSDAPPPPPSSDQPPPPQSPANPKDAKARAKAEKAYAKASRPWYKKKRFIIPGALLLLIIVGAALSSGDEVGDPGAEDDGVAQEPEGGDETQEESLFPDRVDQQPNDIEAQVGESISVGGYSATVTSLEHTESINDFENEGYLVADVELTNDSDSAQPYNTFDWRLQTPNGQVLDAALVGEEQLGSGDLVQGGNVSGQVYFEVGQDISGEYYVIYKPNAFDDARGIWGKAF